MGLILPATTLVMDEKVIWMVAVVVVILVVLAIGMGIFKNIQGIISGI